MEEADDNQDDSQSRGASAAPERDAAAAIQTAAGPARRLTAGRAGPALRAGPGPLVRSRSHPRPGRLATPAWDRSGRGPDQGRGGGRGILRAAPGSVPDRLCGRVLAAV